jgi:hypothetical protein
MTRDGMHSAFGPLVARLWRRLRGFAAVESLNWTFANWAFKPPNTQLVKIAILAAPAFLISAAPSGSEPFPRTFPGVLLLAEHSAISPLSDSRVPIGRDSGLPLSSAYHEAHSSFTARSPAECRPDAAEGLSQVSPWWTFGENRANHRPISSKDVTAYGPMG